MATRATCDQGEYFANYFLHMSDVTFDMRSNEMHVHQRRRTLESDTGRYGEDAMTGGRLLRVADFVRDEEAFCFTYGTVCRTWTFPQRSPFIGNMVKRQP